MGGTKLNVYPAAWYDHKFETTVIPTPECVARTLEPRHISRAQMAAGPVDSRRLGAAVSWSQEYQSAQAAVPLLLWLARLTVRLAESNHRGQTKVA